MKSPKRKLTIVIFTVAMMTFFITCSLRSSSSANEAGGSGQNEEMFVVSPSSELSRRSGAKIERNNWKGTPPRIIILWTTWRSGSTYTGELLAKSLPMTFFSTEPLRWWREVILHKNDSKTKAAFEFLHDLLHCQVHPGYIKQVTSLKNFPYYMQWNSYFSQSCVPLDACTNTTFISNMCMTANIHVVKVVRLSLKWAWRLLHDEDLDIKMIYLARDPRAVLSSRSRRIFCKDDTCKDPDTVCRLLEEDLNEVKKMLQRFPKRFRFIQYERIFEDAKTGLENLMTFVSLPVSEAQLELLHPNTTDPDGPFAINKDAKWQVNRWRTMNEYERVLRYQTACLRPISELGLRVFESEEELLNLSLPLVVSDPLLF
ncbi:carbohydrate sulfotransferase 5-like [Macrobrachium rosenbergii]|uniref:carbohydrate sulfotransferase 5-like n=1 Tax=Macrobrachium rosenbergii TaxID=79674 RepID=UPI0034D4055F